jgi:hypothetical protein
MSYGLAKLLAATMTHARGNCEHMREAVMDCSATQVVSGITPQ